MSASTVHEDIQSRIQAFLAELSGLVRKSALEAVHEALGEGAAPKRRGRPRGAVPRARRAVAGAGKRVRRSAEDLEKIAARVLAHVKSNAGHRLEQIGAALATDTAVLKRPIANLLAAKQIRTEGRKRGTKYFPGGKRGGRKAKRAPKARRGRKGMRKRAARRTTKAPAAVAPPSA
jgi:hypothetical protein